MSEVFIQEKFCDIALNKDRHDAGMFAIAYGLMIIGEALDGLGLNRNEGKELSNPGTTARIADALSEIASALSPKD